MKQKQKKQLISQPWILYSPELSQHISQNEDSIEVLKQSRG